MAHGRGRALAGTLVSNGDAPQQRRYPLWVKGRALVEPGLRWALPVLTLAWAVFLFWVLTSTRGGEAAVSASPDFFDRLVAPAAHLGGFGVLAGLALLSSSRTWPRLPMPLAASFVTATLYGAALELYQTTLPARAGTWGDVALNASGAAAALGALTVLRRWRGSAARR